LGELAKEFEMEKGHRVSLAFFRSPGTWAAFRLPGEVEPCWAVEGRLLVRPLIRFLREHRPFHLLALARKHIRLLECQPEACRDVELPESVPRDLQSFGDFDRPDHDLFNQSPAGRDAGRMVSVQFGTTTDKPFQRLHDFHKAIDRGIWPLLEGKRLPLVLAGTDADAASFRKVASFQPVVGGFVSGSPDGGVTDSTLFRLGNQLMEHWLSDEERQAVHEFMRAGSTQVSVETGTILRFAAKGRVHHLFLTASQPQLGDADHIAGKRLHAGEFSGNQDDLVNAAVVETIKHKGRVWYLPEERMPAKATLAAMFRF
jgi:hypothetical protein